jgi:hypothetical protein
MLCIKTDKEESCIFVLSVLNPLNLVHLTLDKTISEDKRARAKQYHDSKAQTVTASFGKKN